MQVNFSFDKPKLVLTVLDPIDASDFDQIYNKVEEELKYVAARYQEEKVDKLPYDKENIILPRQLTYIYKVQDSRFPKKKKNRMIWDETEKKWILRRHKKRVSTIPPIIEATKQDAYEDVFRKKEIEQEIKKAQKQIRTQKKDKFKQKKLQQVKKQL
ncbi:hypothetical protein pb186bvf_016462 [Paramecium bursaria]